MGIQSTQVTATSDQGPRALQPELMRVWLFPPAIYVLAEHGNVQVAVPHSCISTK
jgi:hypothetical protein